jgi:hypothetical protein
MSTLLAGDQGLLEHGVVVQSLRTQLLHGRDGLADVPVTLERVLREEAWRDRIDTNTRERFTFDYFPDFVAADPPAGLGASLDLVERIVRGTPVELVLHEARKTRGRRTDLADIISDVGRGGSHGTTRAYTLDRLKRERPDLLKRVDAGELSANAAAIEAGFRKPKATIPVDTPDAAIGALLRRFSHDELDSALRAASGEERS